VLYSRTWFLVVAIGAVGASLSAPALPPAPTSEYPDEYTYRLAYATVPGAPGAEPFASELAEQPRTLASGAKAFLRHAVNTPLPQIAGGARPLIALGQEEPERQVIENWIRYQRKDFASAMVAFSALGEGGPARPSEGAPARCTAPLASTHSPAEAWDTVYTMIAVYGSCPNAAILPRDALGRAAELLVVEPRIPSGISSREADTELTPVQYSSRAWPFPAIDADPARNEVAAQFWFRRPQFTGLDLAIDQLQVKVPNLNQSNATRVRIAHLDTGYPDLTEPVFAGYPLPPNFRAQLSADCYEPVSRGLDVPCWTGGTSGIDISNHDPVFNKTSWFLTNYLHGAGTLSILAGGYIDANKPLCAPASTPHWGADPCAEVFEIRVGQSFVHFNEESMAAGIYQAVDTQADVISLSHGGFPAAILSRAVDYAYTNGTPIFAASGDFLGTYFLSTPKTVVFPARYFQVMNVTGVTAGGRSAGKHCALLFCVWRFWGGNGFWHNLEDWLIGTNYGPSGVMAEHSIAAYTPNITIYDLETKHAGLSNDELGTSAAVPQAAAAAALWLEYNRDSIEADGRIHPSVAAAGAAQAADIWRTWRKTEAVYQAMLISANKKVPGLSGQQSDAYVASYFGAGVLDAQAMLHHAYARPDICQKRRRSRADLFWWADAIASISIFDVLDWPAAPGLADVTREAFGNSSRTELAQAAYRSTELATLLAQMSQELTPTGPEHCQDTTNDFAKVPTAQWRRLSTLISGSSDASQTLKRSVQAVAKLHGA
jgi:hypothetical protein